MGLRERKKARLRAAILEVAGELSHEQGFEALRVRDLIERLEISEATFFNYFASKSVLLDAWLEDELANAFANLEPDSRSRRAELRRCVRQLARDAADAQGLATASWLGGRIQLAVHAAVARCPLPALLEAARDGGELRRDIEPAELAELLIGNVALAIGSARIAGAPPEPRALRAVELVLDGARRRHERVRLKTGASRPPAPPPSPTA